jgi:hypothetical protein
VDMTVKPCRTSCWSAVERRFGNSLPTSPLMADRQRFSLPFLSDASVRQNGRTGA